MFIDPNYHIHENMKLTNVVLTYRFHIYVDALIMKVACCVHGGQSTGVPYSFLKATQHQCS